ncbi:ferritin-like domain-containing protein [Pseudonocardia sp. DSM 110487]|uniref:ferritin-like domain-containing protein n=1 Tax=Pseudonocardia sp. DSM 110487 TaxID=2865833 RepID=UPI0021082468|nr:ferritin-like domain-containing protein [Pseudonocardia sp. DSM 110487]
MTSGNPRIGETAVAALQNALMAEHAAIWSYALAVAFLSGADAARAREDEEAHRELRNQVEETLTQLGAPAVSAQPAYSTPRPVTDPASAAQLAAVAETDALAAWRSVLERSRDRALRQAALDTLSAGTLRCARWRAAIGESPTIPVFPGQP